MKRWALLTLLTITFLSALGVEVLAEPRFALVIGNGTYDRLTRLRNPVADA